MKRRREPYCYVTREGRRYYVHERGTRTRPGYGFVRDVTRGALMELPAGYTVFEGANGAAFLRKQEPADPEARAEDVAVVQAELDRAGRLTGYKARAVGMTIVIIEPRPRQDEAEFRSDGFVVPSGARAYLEERLKVTHYAGVVKFEPVPGGYTARQRTYRGMGGWTEPGPVGALKELARQWVAKIGRDEFYRT